VPFFAGQLFQAHNLGAVLLAFLSFSLAASAMYIFNDIMDLELDKEHPSKSHRPLAQGKVTRIEGTRLALLLTTAALLMALFLPRSFLMILILYISIIGAYYLGLKRVTLLDTFLIATGYILRVLAGQGATGIPASPWLLTTVFLMALLISLGKRKVELELLGLQAHSHRPTLGNYSPGFLDNAIPLTATSTLITYILYTVERGQGLVFTTLPAAYGVLRYLQLLKDNRGGDPIEAFFKDPHLLISGIILLGAIFVKVYL
jgi:4-hydroxybenzoate polyprenyltransferase